MIRKRCDVARRTQDLTKQGWVEENPRWRELCEQRCGGEEAPRA